MSKQINNDINTLISKACAYPPRHPIRQKHLTKIIQLVSAKLWKEDSSYYEDALQKTWIYFCQNLCESKTDCVYAPQKTSVATWLNIYLKHRLQDGYRTRKKHQSKRAFYAAHSPDSSETSAHPIDRIAAQPDIPPVLQDVETWARNTPHLAQVHIPAYPHITAQLLILERLPPEKPWKVLATRLNVPLGTLSSFYQRHCMPLIREFGQNKGYLNV
ncbi:MAG: sigma-70 family RNA polymerase sigma factor [Phormidesmis sp.]